MSLLPEDCLLLRGSLLGNRLLPVDRLLLGGSRAVGQWLGTQGPPPGPTGRAALQRRPGRAPGSLLGVPLLGSLLEVLLREG